MASLKKYNLSGGEVGEIAVDESLIESKINSQLVKDYIVALRANARQWSASTQGRSDVNHTTRKPHPQKGTGRARQGRLSSPQYKGGGVVFGPKPKNDQHVRVNKKERRVAIRALLAEKIAEQRVHVLDSGVMEGPRTKQVAQFMQALELNKRTLFLSEGKRESVETEGVTQVVDVKASEHRNLALSLRNLPKVEHNLAMNVNGYDLLRAHDLVITEAALNELLECFAKTAKKRG